MACKKALNESLSEQQHQQRVQWRVHTRRKKLRLFFIVKLVIVQKTNYINILITREEEEYSTRTVKNFWHFSMVSRFYSSQMEKEMEGARGKPKNYYSPTKWVLQSSLSSSLEYIYIRFVYAAKPHSLLPCT